MIKTRRDIAIIFIIFIASIPIYSQYNLRGHILGPRIPNINSEDLQYFDTIIYRSTIKIDSIVKNSSTHIDTFSQSANFRELVFKFPSDSVFVFKEHLSHGQLINSKRNGFWTISLYDFFGDIKTNHCDKSGRIDLYFNDHLLFDASPPVSSGDLILNHDLNTIDLSFRYEMKDSIVLMKIACVQDTLNDYYTCTLGSDSVVLAKVKSTYLDMELQFLFAGEYDRKINYER
jgi:hypothetical protein